LVRKSFLNTPSRRSHIRTINQPSENAGAAQSAPLRHTFFLTPRVSALTSADARGARHVNQLMQTNTITENLVEAEWHGLKKENRLRALTWMLVNEIVDDDGEEDDPFGGGFTSEATLRARIQHILNYFAHLIVEQYGVEGEVMKIAEPFPNSDDPRVVKLRAAMIEMLKDPQAWDATRSWVMKQCQQR
jgi:hypothetical protein